MTSTERRSTRTSNVSETWAHSGIEDSTQPQSNVDGNGRYQGASILVALTRGEDPTGPSEDYETDDDDVTRSSAIWDEEDSTLFTLRPITGKDWGNAIEPRDKAQWAEDEIRYTKDTASSLSGDASQSPKDLRSLPSVGLAGASFSHLSDEVLLNRGESLRPDTYSMKSVPRRSGRLAVQLTQTLSLRGSSRNNRNLDSQREDRQNKLRTSDGFVVPAKPKVSIGIPLEGNTKVKGNEVLPPKVVELADLLTQSEAISPEGPTGQNKGTKARNSSALASKGSDSLPSKHAGRKGRFRGGKVTTALRPLAATSDPTGISGQYYTEPSTSGEPGNVCPCGCGLVIPTVGALPNGYNAVRPGNDPNVIPHSYSYGFGFAYGYGYGYPYVYLGPVMGSLSSDPQASQSLTSTPEGFTSRKRLNAPAVTGLDAISRPTLPGMIPPEHVVGRSKRAKCSANSVRNPEVRPASSPSKGLCSGRDWKKLRARTGNAPRGRLSK